MSLWCSKDENYFKKLLSCIHTQAKADNGPVCPKELSTFLSGIFSPSCLTCQYVNMLSASHLVRGTNKVCALLYWLLLKVIIKHPQNPAGRFSAYLPLGSFY